MGIKAHSTELPGLLFIEPSFFADERGSFCETYNQEQYRDIGISAAFVQDNESVSIQGVLRGFHAQLTRPQAKLVRVVKGEIYDVGVDARPGSPTFGKWHGHLLSGENRLQLFLPAGFFHGFYVVQGPAIVHYKCSDIYIPGDQVGFKWDDPDIAIDWPCVKPLLSERDACHPGFAAQRSLWDAWKL